MESRIYAPELTCATAWLNCDRPLSMKELRGNVVVLDFWTFCCINCMHVMPVLNEIERRHEGEPLVVIGIHSGKFDAEKNHERIMQAIERYNITHPVAVDDEMAIWSEYCISSWPTIVVIKPDGTVAAIAPGEPDLELLDSFITKLLDESRKQGKLNFNPPNIRAVSKEHDSPLRFPGKLTVLSTGDILISDSGNNRLIIATPDGIVKRVIGCGIKGLRDGSFELSSFDDPQGTCEFAGAIFVADTRNHAIRKIDLNTETVTTVAGTGSMGVNAFSGRRTATETPLRSPWDIVCLGDELVIAMAGSHQLHRFNPTEGYIEPYAGTGVESLIDGDLMRSAWAQPSGLSVFGDWLFVADSETSAIRALNTKSRIVRTLIGKGLFNFGDVDGKASECLLQHCLGVEATSEGLFIADTYNGKIKFMSFASGEVSTIVRDLNEPNCVRASTNGSLLICDTNAHRILHFKNGEMKAIEFHDLPSVNPQQTFNTPSAKTKPCADADDWFTHLLKPADSEGLSIGTAEIRLCIKATEGCKFSQGSTINTRLEVSRRSDLLLIDSETLSETADGKAEQLVKLPVQVSDFKEVEIDAEIVAKISFVLCDDAQGLCTPKTLHLRIPVRLISNGGKNTISYSISL